jgi:hypothetical protein
MLVDKGNLGPPAVYHIYEQPILVLALSTLSPTTSTVESSVPAFGTYFTNAVAGALRMNGAMIDDAAAPSNIS